MANSFFQFKQFKIFQDACGMKVGTDGVLLGAWSDIDAKKRVLDIGTGTGLVALMIAQRALSATITGIEIDPLAAQQAKENIENSPWPERIRVLNIDFLKFAENENASYDLIVSNPPFFENSLKANCQKRSQARHTDTLPFEQLFYYTYKLLTNKGSFNVVYPYPIHEKIIALAQEIGFKIKRELFVKGNATSPIKRVLIEFSKSPSEDQIVKHSEELIIEEARHNYTMAYRNLTKDFYLKL